MFVAQRIASSHANFTYLVGDPQSKRAVLIDPSVNAEVGLAMAEEHGFTIEGIFNTHEHWDHCQDNALAKHRTGAKVYAHRLADVPAKDHDLEDGQILKFGELKLKVLHTPGHTHGSVCFLVGKHCFTGDTLFVGNIGRIDFPESSPQEMYHSLFDVLHKLPDETEVGPGHDYGRTPMSTIGREKRENPNFRKDAFEKWLSLP